MSTTKLIPTLSSEAIEQVINWAYQAGEIALKHFQKVTPKSKPDHTFLTQADLEIEHFLFEQIHSVYPDHAIIGEEKTHSWNGRNPSYTWAIDPLDGTTAFVQGLSGWGISIGLLYEGQPDFGLFYMPLLDDLTYTTAQGEVYCAGRILEGSLRSHWGQKGFLAINASGHHDFDIQIKRTRALGSVSTNLVYTARGTAVAALIPKAYLWDLAAGAAILARVGGELHYLSGQPLHCATLLSGQMIPEPVIAGHPKILSDLSAAIHTRSSDKQPLY